MKSKVSTINPRLSLLRTTLQSLGKPLQHALPKKTFVSKALQQIHKTWSDIEPINPKLFSFEEIFLRLSRTLTYGGKIIDLSLRDRRLLPWVLFYPASNPQQWLGSNPDVTVQYLDWLARSKNTSALLTLLKVILIQYPKESSNFTVWLEEINNRLQENKSPRLAVWKERIDRFKLLSINGPQSFGTVLLNARNDPKTICVNAGLVDDMERANFLKESINLRLNDVPSLIRSKDLTSEHLLSLLGFLESSKGQIYFESLRKKIADSFLLPFANENPDKDKLKVLQEFFLRCYGDPRIWPWAQWQFADPRAREVVLRWLTHATLKDFFAIIARTADERVWRYRENFWSAYLNRGFISDAWVALGNIANITASKSFRDNRAAYATLKGGASNHSVLILRIGNLVIVEWSHSGTCRVWNTSNKNSPKLYKSEYSRPELVAGADFEKRHLSSESGNWQSYVSNHIRRQTGITIKPSEYMS